MLNAGRGQRTGLASWQIGVLVVWLIDFEPFRALARLLGSCGWFGASGARSIGLLRAKLGLRNDSSPKKNTLD